ncbi:hypothetical protein ACVISU_002066 [Bradyrhizobium sp. USDA 4452]
MNFQVTVLKILAAYPEGFAVMEDLKRDMAILTTSGRDWADRTRRLAARVPDLDIWSQGLVERISGGWRLTSKGREVLEFMEARPMPEPIQAMAISEITVPNIEQMPVPPLRQAAERAKRRRERRGRRREARERARANASARPKKWRKDEYMSSFRSKVGGSAKYPKLNESGSGSFRRGSSRLMGR